MRRGAVLSAVLLMATAAFGSEIGSEEPSTTSSVAATTTTTEAAGLETLESGVLAVAPRAPSCEWLSTRC